MLTEQQRRELDWEKTDGLMPVIVQHAVSGEVLSLIHISEPTRHLRIAYAVLCFKF
ncbi:hypothetical protein ACX3V1_08130, partial [Escherichia coli]